MRRSTGPGSPSRGRHGHASPRSNTIGAAIRRGDYSLLCASQGVRWLALVVVLLLVLGVTFWRLGNRLSSSGSSKSASSNRDDDVAADASKHLHRKEELKGLSQNVKNNSVSVAPRPSNPPLIPPTPRPTMDPILITEPEILARTGQRRATIPGCQWLMERIKERTNSTLSSSSTTGITSNGQRIGDAAALPPPEQDSTASSKQGPLLSAWIVVDDTMLPQEGTPSPSSPMPFPATFADPSALALLEAQRSVHDVGGANGGARLGSGNEDASATLRQVLKTTLVEHLLQALGTVAVRRLNSLWIAAARDGSGANGGADQRENKHASSSSSSSYSSFAEFLSSSGSGVVVTVISTADAGLMNPGVLTPGAGGRAGAAASRPDPPDVVFIATSAADSAQCRAGTTSSTSSSSSSRQKKQYKSPLKGPCLGDDDRGNGGGFAPIPEKVLQTLHALAALPSSPALVVLEPTLPVALPFAGFLAVRRAVGLGDESLAADRDPEKYYAQYLMAVRSLLTQRKSYTRRLRRGIRDVWRLLLGGASSATSDSTSSVDLVSTNVRRIGTVDIWTPLMQQQNQSATLGSILAAAGLSLKYSPSSSNKQPEPVTTAATSDHADDLLLSPIERADRARARNIHDGVGDVNVNGGTSFDHRWLLRNDFISKVDGLRLASFGLEAVITSAVESFCAL